MANEAWIIWRQGEPIGVRPDEESAKAYGRGLFGDPAVCTYNITGPHAPEGGTFSPVATMIREAKEARNG